MDGLARLNALPQEAAEAMLLEVCSSRAWAATMARMRPFGNREALLRRADEVWRDLASEDWLEAFSAHPRIGERAHAGGGRHAAWAAEEQSGVQQAQADVLAELRDANARYEERFGYVFLICATGRTAGDMLASLKSRLPNDPEIELHVAAEQQRMITRLRLEKMLAS